MTKRITSLTAKQRAALAAHADEWIAHGWSTEPADWDLFEDAARRCYGFSGLPWHGNVVRVSSPLALALAAPTAAFLLALRRNAFPLGYRAGPVGHEADGLNEAVNVAVAAALDNVIDPNLNSAVTGAVLSGTPGVVNNAVTQAVGNAVRHAVNGPLTSAVGNAVGFEAINDVRSAAVALNGAVSGVDLAVSQAVFDAINTVVTTLVHDAVRQVTDGVEHAVGTGAHLPALNGVAAAVHGAVGDAVNDRLQAVVRETVSAGLNAVNTAAGHAVGAEVNGALALELEPQMALSAALHHVIERAVREVLTSAITEDVLASGGLVPGDPGWGNAVGSTVDAAVVDALHDRVFDAVGGPVEQQVMFAINTKVHTAVRRAVAWPGREDVVVRVGQAVDEEVPQAAVEAAVDSALVSAARQASSAITKALYETIRSGWHYRLWGNLWPYWQAYNSFFRDVCALELPGDLWDRSRAYEDTAKSAGWWWPHREFVMVCDRPAVLHLEQVGDRGWSSHRMHCETGPAIAWRDGYALHFWHGVRVPADLIEGDGWDVQRILREPNSEVRRAAIEKVGWDRFIADAGFAQVGDTVPDPGNPGHTLSLFDIPDDIYDTPVRVLLCTNGSVERDGTRRRFGLTVPKNIANPVRAAAWTYGMNTAEYLRAEARR